MRSTSLEVALDRRRSGPRPDALFVGIGPFFTSRRVQLAILAARHLVPMTSGSRAIAEAGGLMSYGSDILDARRQVGVYVGRILKGQARRSPDRAQSRPGRTAP